MVLHEVEKISAIKNGYIEEAVALLEAEQKVIETISQAEQAAQQAQWHKEMVLEPLAKAQIVQDRLKLGTPLEEAQIQPFSDAQIRVAMLKVQQNFELQQAQAHLEPPRLGTDRRNKYNVFIVQIIDTLKLAPEGLTKTEILKSIKKNSTWRQMRDDILNYLEVKGRVRKIGTRYIYESNTNRILETTFHRKIYESLADGAKTVNAIVTLKEANGQYVVGYNNTTGRKKVKDVLTLLWREGLITRTIEGSWVISQ
jgi:virulence-associated protein VapD